MQPRRALLLLLAASLAARLLLAAQGGQYFFGDEERYHRGLDLYRALVEARWTDARGLLALPEHAAFVWLGALLGPLQQLGAWFTGHGDWSQPANIYASAAWAAGLLGLFSAGCLWFVSRLAIATGADESAAFAAALLAACSNTLFYFSRHLLPYDVALCAWLGGLLLATRPGRRAQWFSGLLIGLTYHFYNGYWFLVPVGGLWWWLRPRSATEGWVAPAAGAAVGLCMPWTVGSFCGGLEYWRMMRDFSGTVKQGLFAEGWSLPAEYLWHSEGWWGGLVLAAVLLALFRARSGLPRHVVQVLACVVAVYVLLVLASTVAHKFVIYGRTVRPLVPLLCLVAGWAAAQLTTARPVWRAPLAVTALVAATLMFAPQYLRVFPREFEQRVLLEFGMTKRSLEFSGCIYQPLALPVTRPDLLLVNAQGLYPLRDRLPAPPDPVLLSCEHPAAIHAYQYEGYSPRERRLIRAAPLEMKLIRLRQPADWPDHPPRELLYSETDRPDGLDQ